MPQFSVDVEDDNGQRFNIVVEGDSAPTEDDIASILSQQQSSAPATRQQASVGELRRREGMGEISSAPRSEKVARSGWLGTVLDAIGRGPVMGTPATFTPAQDLPFEMGSPEQKAAMEGRVQGLTQSFIPEYQIPQQEGKAAQVAAGLGQIGIDVARGIASPIGVAAGGLATGAVGVPARVGQAIVAGAFAPSAVEAVKQGVESVTSGTDTLQQQVTKVGEGTLAVAGTVAPFVPRGTRGAPTGANATLAPSAAISEEGVAAAERLSKKLGVEAPLSAAQQTGSPGVARFEAFSRRIGPGMTAEMLGMEAQQMKVADAVAKFVEKASSQTPEDVGRRVVGEMAAGEERIAGRAAKAAESGAKDVVVSAEQQIQKATGLTPKETSEVGNLVRQDIQSGREANRNFASSLFAEAENELAAAGAPKEFVQFPSTKSVVQKIFSESPKDTSGNVAPEFLKAYSTLKEIQSLPPQTLEAAQRTKSIIGEAIGRLEDGKADAFGAGFQLGDLKWIYGSLKRDIDSSIEQVSPVARDKFRTAVEYYAKNIEAGERSPILRRIINEASEGGLANSAEIVRYFSQGAGRVDDLAAIKPLLSKGTYDQLRRGIIDSVAGQSFIPTSSGGAVVDLSTLRESFGKLSPEFKRELLGSDAAVADLQSVLDRFRTAKKVIESVGKTDVASPGQLANLVDSIREGKSRAGIAEFNKAVFAEAQRRKSYYNDITKKISSGKLGEVPIDPARLVDEVFLAADRPELVRDALRQLTPETRREVQVLAAKNLLQQAMDIESSTLARIIGGETNLKSERIVNLMVDNPVKRQVINQLLPSDLKPVIEDFVAYRRAIDQAYKQGGGQGLVAATEQFSGGFGKGSPLDAPFRWVNGAARMLINRKLADFTFNPNLGVPVLKFMAQPNVSAISLAAWPFRAIGGRVSPEGIGYLTAIYGGEQVDRYLKSEEELRSRLGSVPNKEDADMVKMLTGIDVPSGKQSAAPSQQQAPTAPQRPSTVPVPVPNRNGRLSIQPMGRDEALKLLEEQRSFMNNILQSLDQR